MSTWTKVIFIKFSQLFTIHVHSDSTFLPSGKCRLKFAWFTCSFKKYVLDFWYILSSFQLWAASYVSTTVLFANISFLFIHHLSLAIIYVILKSGIFRLLSSSSFCHLISSLRASSVLFIKSSISITLIYYMKECLNKIPYYTSLDEALNEFV